MNLTTKGVTEDSRFIKYGIREVKITGIEAKEIDVVVPSILMNFQEINSNKTVNVSFSFSERASQFSLRKIKHIATKIVTEKDIDDINTNTVTEYAEALKKLILNKEVRIKFNGEEIDGQKNGKRNWFKSVIGFAPFAESISVSMEQTSLRFDELRDIKRLPVMTTDPISSTPKTESNLPF